MGAERPQRRKITAKEAAARLGVSPRTVQRIIAEPREEFLGRAVQRRAEAARLRQQGLKYAEIADEMGISIGAASRLLRDARRLDGLDIRRGGAASGDAPDAPSTTPGDALHDAPL